MRLRPRFSTLVAAGVAMTGVVLLVAAMLLGQSTESSGRTIVTVRLWDEQVAVAYRESFAEFSREHPDAVRQVLAWMGGTRGNEYLGAHGATIPAVLAAQPVYLQYWRSRGVDVGPFFTVLNGPRIAAPGGAGFDAGFDALKPYFDEMFLGRRDDASTLADAQQAANSAAQR